MPYVYWEIANYLTPRALMSTIIVAFLLAIAKPVDKS